MSRCCKTLTQCTPDNRPLWITRPSISLRQIALLAHPRSLIDAILGAADGCEGYKALGTPAIGILCGHAVAFGLLDRACAQRRDKSQHLPQPIRHHAGIEAFHQTLR